MAKKKNKRIKNKKTAEVSVEETITKSEATLQTAANHEGAELVNPESVELDETTVESITAEISQEVLRKEKENLDAHFALMTKIEESKAKGISFAAIAAVVALGLIGAFAGYLALVEPVRTEIAAHKNAQSQARLLVQEAQERKRNAELAIQESSNYLANVEAKKRADKNALERAANTVVKPMRAQAKQGKAKKKSSDTSHLSNHDPIGDMI